LDTVQKMWAPLRKLFAPLGTQSWLRACSRGKSWQQPVLGIKEIPRTGSVEPMESHHCVHVRFANVMAPDERGHARNLGSTDQTVVPPNMSN